MWFDVRTFRYKIGICIIGLTLISWLFSIFVVFPARQRLADIENKIEIERNWVRRAQEFSLTYPEPIKYLKLLDDKLQLLVEMLPSESQINEFLLQSEIAARDSGVQLKILKPGAALNKNGYREYPIELVVHGDFFQTMNFIKTIETNIRFNNVKGSAMQVKSGYLESRFLITVYSL